MINVSNILYTEQDAYIIRPHNARPRSRLGTHYFGITRGGHMDPLRILKALSNPHRLDIILWLKHPEKEFGVQVHTNTLIDFPNSVSVKSIQKRCGVSQSSISTFMSILENAKLVESRKIDQYTYFRRNEKVIREFGEWYNKEVSIQSDDIDKLLKTLNLEDTSYPTLEETSAPGEQLAAEINTKGSDHDENRK